MATLKDTLISRDSKGKIRVVEMTLNWSDELHSYLIERQSGLLTGKKVIAPVIEVKQGKAKRTVSEQATLQYNSELKKYLDKGYKKIQDLGIDTLTVESAENALPTTNTDQNGALKPMLCKVLDKENKKLTEKEWFGSYKHDGVRMLLFLRDGEVHTSSRGGGDYDVAAKYIREDEYINKIFKDNPNLILDGELYAHGYTLNQISGWVRKESSEEEHKLLKYHCYDIVDEHSKFKDRVKILDKLRSECPENSKLVVIEQRKIKGLDQIMAMHNEAVAAGYEGLVIKDPEKEYKCGARDNRCCKIKEFQDAEFKILGIVEGLREEDMCFLMETSDGTQFKAKPIGDRAQKQWYREHIDEIIGKLGTVKYFGMTNTEHPVPNLPSFRAIRNENDL